MATCWLAINDFWEAITEKMCKMIEESISEFHDAGWISRAFGEDHEKGERLLARPSAAQAAEDANYANQLELDRMVQPGSEMAGVVNSLTSLTGSGEDPSDGQRATSPLLDVTHVTPVTDRRMTSLSSKTTTTGVSLSNDNTDILDSFVLASPTSGANVDTNEGEQDMTSPSSQSSESEKQVRRRLSFGMPEFGNDHDYLKRPLRKAGRPSPGSEDDLFAQFIDLTACAPDGTEVSFTDVPTSQMEGLLTSTPQSVRLDKTPPKTPVLVEFGSPPLPIVVRDDTHESYPTCYVSTGTLIPLEHLEFLREAVDPTFQNNQWGDSLYFLDEPVYSCYSNDSEEYGFRRKDWSTIFHALDNGSDRQFPLPDTQTRPRFTDEQVYRMFHDPTAADQRNDMMREWKRHWTRMQMNIAGLKWSEVRGSYSNEAPEVAVTSIEKICASPEFEAFCKSASFYVGRQAEKPELDDTSAVLRYARLPNSLRNQSKINRSDQLGVHASQQPLAANTTPRQHPATCSPLNLEMHSNTRNASASIRLHAPLQRAPGQTQQTNQASPVLRVRPNSALLNKAYNNFREFASLTPAILRGLHNNFLQARALHYGSQGLPVPDAAPTYQEVWQNFRRDVEARRAAARVQTRSTPEVPPLEVLAARDRTMSNTTPSRMLRDASVPDSGTAVTSRAVRFPSHVPATPSTARKGQANGSERMMARATDLGSPSVMPRSMRSADRDSRLR